MKYGAFNALGALPLQKLTEQFASLPGIGRKTAGRLAFHILTLSKSQAKEFADSIVEAHEKIKQCSICKNYTENNVCNICSNDNRDKTIICVVEDSKDIVAFERTRNYTGTYHVLGGLISPMDGVGPDQLYIKELLLRVTSQNVKEVIMAQNPTVEGEATAIYLFKLLTPFGIKVTRLAFGIAVGCDLEYTDEITLGKALENRQGIVL